MSKKQLTTGQRLARLLRTAVVEAQAIETGRHPNVMLNMGEYVTRRRDGVCEVCLGGALAMMGLGLGPHLDESFVQVRLLTREERALNSLRAGNADCAAEHLDLPLIADADEYRFRDKVQSTMANHDWTRADWDTYLEAADILEKA